MKRVSSNEPYDLLGKFLLAGNCCVGKSTLLYRLTDNNFTTTLPSTIGVEFAAVRFKAKDGTGIKLQVWDCAGQERFQSIVNSYFRQANVILFVYDITKWESFKELEGWFDRAHSAMNGKDYLKVLIGNKADLGMLRAVDFETAKDFAVTNGALFFEVSAKEPECGDVVDTFEKILQETYTRYLRGENLLMTNEFAVNAVSLSASGENHPSKCNDCLR